MLVLSTAVTLTSWTEEGAIQYHIKPSIQEPDIVVKLPPSPEQLDKLVVEQKPDDENEVKMDEKEDKLDVNQEKVNLDVPFDPDEQAAVVIHDADSAKVKEVEIEEKQNEEVHKQLDKDLSKLAARVEQLEEENKDLKVRQEVIEKIQEHDFPEDGGKTPIDSPVLNEDRDKPHIDSPVLNEDRDKLHIDSPVLNEDRGKPRIDKEKQESEEIQAVGGNIEAKGLNHKSLELEHSPKLHATTEVSVGQEHSLEGGGKEDHAKEVTREKREIKEEKYDNKKDNVVISDVVQQKIQDNNVADKEELVAPLKIDEQDGKKQLHIARDLKSISSASAA